MKGDAGGKRPAFLWEYEITCGSYAAAVNYYVAMGEQNGIEALESVALLQDTDSDVQRAKTRMAFTCRVLFEPVGKNQLRPPMFGGLMIPYHTMPLERWPHYPVVCVGSSCFVLSESYLVSGCPESAIDYLNYCRAEGRFRMTTIPIPNRGQAITDLNRLRNSKQWQAIKWGDRGLGWSYGFSEERTHQYLANQVR